jgi:hypothetical protein
MAHALTEVSSFDTPLIVPDGTDPGTDRTEDVEAIAQTLGNRTTYLIDTTAKVGEENTFTEVNTFTERILSALTSAVIASFDVARVVTGGPIWQLALRVSLNASGSVHAGIWAGADVADNRLMIVTNARWNGSAWEQETSSRSSTAIGFTSTSLQALTIYQVPAGTAPWTAWNLGTLIGGIVTATDFVYSKNRAVPVPLGGSSTEYDMIAGANYGSLLPMSTANSKHIALRFPANMNGCTLQIQHYKADTASSAFEVLAMTVNWTTPGALTSTTVGGVQTSTTAGAQITSITIPTIVPGTEYRLRWAAANTGDRLLAVRANSMSDAGPLNTL